MRALTCILLSLIVSVSIDALNVLVYSPAFANSHQNFMGHLADTLTDAGHNVTLLVPVADEARKYKLGVKTTKNIVYVDKDEIAEKNIAPIEDSMDIYWLERFKAEDLIESFTWFNDIMVETCANLYRNPTIFDEMKSRNFDVVMIEPLSVCGMGLAHKLGIKNMILTSSCTHYDFTLPYIGEPEEHGYVPHTMGQATDKMNIFERYENYKISLYMHQNLERLFDAEEKIYKARFGNEMPSWTEFFPRASLYFTNSNPNIDFPRSTIQKTVPIGGISVNMEHIKFQKIPEEWDDVLEQRSKTMLISFGSMVLSKHMPLEWRENLLKVIASFPEVTFIWKYESNNTQWASHVKNVHFSQWVPQTALLGDKRITAFLTHGGLGSTNELAHCGKPALMIPVFADQIRNANMLSRHHGVIVVDKHDLRDYNIIRTAVESILYDETYKQNAERLAEILENQPVKPKDLVVKYTEFVAKFGPFPQMDPYVRHLNFIQRHSLDILAIFHLRHIFVVFVILFVSRLFFSRVRLSIVKKKNN